VPRITVPLGRGVELTDRACWVVLGAAMAVSATLLLYMSRGTTFGIDELVWVFQSPGLGLTGVLEPYNGSLVATNRIVYKAILETAGAEYIAFRLLWIGSVLLSAGLLYALIKRWIGALPALAPAIVLLFLGSAGEYFTSAIGFIALFAISAGLAALLALERDDTLGDIAACALIVVSVATFTIGLGFLAGVAISVMLRRDRASRAWIVLVPLALYAAWWLWALGEPGSSEGQAKLSNVLLVPNYAADSLAASLAAVTGLSYDFLGSQQGTAIGWGYVLAAVALGALVIRFIRGGLPRSVWITLGIVLTVWAAGTLVVGVFRPPDSARYLYMGAVGVVMVAAAAATSVRFTRAGLAILFGVAVVGVMTNIAQLRDRARDTRDGYSVRAETAFAMMELARDEVDPAYTPPLIEFDLTQIPLDAGSYLRAANEYGSEAIPIDALEREDVTIREHADSTLAGALDLRLEPARAGAPGPCRSEPDAGGFELAPGAATIVARGRRTAKLSVGRFADPSVELGRLEPGEPARLVIPTDSDPRPWLVAVKGANSVRVCATR